MAFNDKSRRAAARQHRLAAFPGEGPSSEVACELLCEDQLVLTRFRTSANGQTARGEAFRQQSR